MKKKVAIFHELPNGGARRGAIEFALGLKKFYDVDLYYVDQEENTREREYADNVYFFGFHPKSWSGGNWKTKLYKDTIELFKLYLLHRKIAQKINTQKYEFVFVHGSAFTQAPFVLRLIACPTLYYCQEPLRMVLEEHFSIAKNLDVFRKGYETLNRFMRKTIDKTNIQHATTILTNSSFTKKNLFVAYGIEGTVCYMGVKTDVFRPIEGKKKYDLLFIGSYDFVDGYPLLQDALKKIKGKKVKVKYITHEDGWISDDNVLRETYNASKAVICFGYREPFGLIPLEAMACGVPVVALDEGGYKDTVKDGETGILVPRDPKIIADTLFHFLTDDVTRLKYGKQARKYIENEWTWNRRVQAFLEIVKKDLFGK